MVQWDTVCIRSSPDPSLFVQVSLACKTSQRCGELGLQLEVVLVNACTGT